MATQEECERLLAEARQELNEERIVLGLAQKALRSAEEVLCDAHARYHKVLGSIGRAEQKVAYLERAMALEPQTAS